MAKQLPRNWVEMRREWPGLSAYQRFEAFVASVLTLGGRRGDTGRALYRLIVSVADTLLLRALNPLASSPEEQHDALEGGVHFRSIRGVGESGVGSQELGVRS